MISVSRIVCILACGFVLGVGLSSETVWAGDEMTISRSALRIGGQAGRPYDHVKHEYAPVLPEERIGGQAGLPYDHPNHPQVQHEEGVEGQAGARIGGQAGRPYDHVRQKHASILPEGRRGSRLEGAMLSSN